MSDIVLGMAMGIGLCVWFMMWLGGKIEQRILREIEEKSNTKSRELKLEIEVHGDMLYAFNHETKDFVCQGSTAKQLKDNLIQRYGQINASIVAGPDETLKAIRKQLLETKNENNSSIRHSS